MNEKNVNEVMGLTRTWAVSKFASRADYESRKSYEENLIEGNLLLNEGINELFTIIGSAASGTKFDNTHTYLGVGDSSATESATQTGLQASTNKVYVAMDTSYPSYGTGQKIVFRATFTETVANFSWQEFTVANGNSDSAVNLNRKISNQGTKISGQIWELTMEISLS
jgi:hypothetical protein